MAARPLETAPDPAARAVEVAWRAIRQSVTQPAAWLDLARGYAARGLSWQAAYALRQAGRLDPDAVRRSGLLPPSGPDDTILGRPGIDNTGSLAERFVAWLTKCPDDWLTWLYLSRLREMPGLADEAGARSAAERAQALEYLPGETWHWLGVWRLNAGDAQGAVSALRNLPA